MSNGVWTESIPLPEIKPGDFSLSHIPGRYTAVRGEIEKVVIARGGKLLGIVVKQRGRGTIAVGAEHIEKCWGYR